MSCFLQAIQLTLDRHQKAAGVREEIMRIFMSKGLASWLGRWVVGT